jgi:hypothetical protein
MNHQLATRGPRDPRGLSASSSIVEGAAQLALAAAHAQWVHWICGWRPQMGALCFLRGCSVLRAATAETLEPRYRWGGVAGQQKKAADGRILPYSRACCLSVK